MAIEVRTHESWVLSIHREPRSLQFYIPNVHPGTYWIPSLDATKKDFEVCQFNFPPNLMRRQPARHVRYASRINRGGRDYVLLKVQDGATHVAEASENSKPFDEYGRALVPNIGRHSLDVSSEDIANEIERQFLTRDDENGSERSIGILAIAAEVPTDDEWKRIHTLQLNHKSWIVTETDKYESRGLRVANEQARRFASDLFLAKHLSVLPRWAKEMNIVTSAPQNICDRCNTAMPVGMPKCITCGKIHNWKLAVDEGYIKPSDVPPSRMKEAGLELAKV